jgi:predicted MPP superfamily phosphohydrolase
LVAFIVVAAIVVVALLAGVHWYLFKRLFNDTFERGRPARRAGGIALAGLGVLIPVTLIGERVLPQAVRPFLAWPGYLWIALMFYLLLSLAVLELVRLATRMRRATQRPRRDTTAGATQRNPVRPGPSVDESRRVLLARGFALGAGAAAVSAVGIGVAQALERPDLKHVPIRLPKLPASMDGFTIAVVSDIHLGPLRGRSHTERIVHMINSTHPDLVAVVGDLVDGSVAELGHAAEPLQDLRSRLGSFFVTGNHEYFSGADAWIKEVQSFGLRVLQNERVEIEGLDLAGVNDATGEPDYAKALDGRDRGRPGILLAHQPVQAHEAARHGADLQLSGHTHGGQMWPFNVVVGIQQPVVAGLGRVDGMPVYVTRGAGFWGPPVRFGAPPDISLVRLHPPA